MPRISDQNSYPLDAIITGTEFLIGTDVDDSTVTFTIDQIGSYITSGITIDELSNVVENVIIGRVTAGSGNSEELTPTQVRSLINVEDGATADQSDAEIETAYNNQVLIVPQAEAEAGTSTTVRRWTAQRVAQAIAALGGGSGGDLWSDPVDSNILPDTPSSYDIGALANQFVDGYFSGDVRTAQLFYDFGAITGQSADPGGSVAGNYYYNSTQNRIRLHNGTEYLNVLLEEDDNSLSETDQNIPNGVARTVQLGDASSTLLFLNQALGNLMTIGDTGVSFPTTLPTSSAAVTTGNQLTTKSYVDSVVTGSNSINVNNIFRDSSGGSLVGTINGSNTTFTVGQGSYVSGSLVVYLNGQALWSGNGITETDPVTGVFDFTAPFVPQVGNSILATYNIEDTSTRDDFEKSLSISETQITTSPNFYNQDARVILKQRFDDSYTAGVGFPDDITNVNNDVTAFTADPDQYRPQMGDSLAVGFGIPSAGQNLHTSAVKAYVDNDEVLANTVCTEILGTVNANDLNTAWWNASSAYRWDADDDLWIQTSKVKKLFDSYNLLVNIQSVLTDAQKTTIETWFERYKTLAETAVRARLQALMGASWEDDATVFYGDSNNVLYPTGSGDTPTPVYDSGGNVLPEYTMILGQDFYNNRQWEAVAYIHSWAIENDDRDSERWTRQFFKAAIKYGLFSDGSWCELFRNRDSDPTLGIFYGYITLSAMVDMAHNDAKANHYPDDRLYDFKTTEGILNGSTTNTNFAYLGGSTTDGTTQKSLLTFITGQSNYLRTQANGGWNDIRFFEATDTTLTALSTVGLRQPSVHAAIANLYYKTQDLEDFYTYNTSVGYPAKVTISEGYLAGTGNEDMGGWGNLIFGSMWYAQEGNFYDYRTYSAGLSGSSITDTDSLPEGSSNLYSQWENTATETIRYTDGSNYIEVETDSSPAIRLISSTNDFPAIHIQNSVRGFRHEVDSNGRWHLKDNTTNNETISVFDGAANNLLKLYTSNVGINIAGLPSQALDVNGSAQADDFRLNALNTAPSSASDTGTTGEVRWTATHVYLCTATDTWVRAALSTW